MQIMKNEISQHQESASRVAHGHPLFLFPTFQPIRNQSSKISYAAIIQFYLYMRRDWLNLKRNLNVCELQWSDVRFNPIKFT